MRARVVVLACALVACAPEPPRGPLDVLRDAVPSASTAAAAYCEQHGADNLARTKRGDIARDVGKARDAELAAACEDLATALQRAHEARQRVEAVP